MIDFCKFVSRACCSDTVRSGDGRICHTTSLCLTDQINSFDHNTEMRVAYSIINQEPCNISTCRSVAYLITLRAEGRRHKCFDTEKDHQGEFTLKTCPLTFISGILGIHLRAADIVLSHNTVCFCHRRRGRLVTRLLSNERA